MLEDQDVSLVADIAQRSGGCQQLRFPVPCKAGGTGNHRHARARKGCIRYAALQRVLAFQVCRSVACGHKIETRRAPRSPVKTIRSPNGARTFARERAGARSWPFLSKRYFTTRMSQSVLRSRNVEMEPSSAYLMEDRPRAPQSTRSGWMTSSISSFRVSRMRPARMTTSTSGMSGFAFASSTWAAMEFLKAVSRPFDQVDGICAGAFRERWSR
mgnify:CR=1 FL=1